MSVLVIRHTFCASNSPLKSENILFRRWCVHIRELGWCAGSAYFAEVHHHHSSHGHKVHVNVVFCTKRYISVMLGQSIFKDQLVFSGVVCAYPRVGVVVLVHNHTPFFIVYNLLCDSKTDHLLRWGHLTFFILLG